MQYLTLRKFLMSGYMYMNLHIQCGNELRITLFFSWRDSPLVGLGVLIHEACFSRSHTTTHHSR